MIDKPIRHYNWNKITREKRKKEVVKEKSVKLR